MWVLVWGCNPVDEYHLNSLIGFTSETLKLGSRSFPGFSQQAFDSIAPGRR